MINDILTNLLWYNILFVKKNYNVLYYVGDSYIWVTNYYISIDILRFITAVLFKHDFCISI